MPAIVEDDIRHAVAVLRVARYTRGSHSHDGAHRMSDTTHDLHSSASRMLHPDTKAGDAVSHPDVHYERVHNRRLCLGVSVAELLRSSFSQEI